jgi:glycosyltransferase involved in cell wall biosynthesis
MRFGIDARMIDQVMDGAGRVTQGLLDHLSGFPQHEFVVFHGRHLISRPALPNIEYRSLPVRISSVRNLAQAGAVFNAAGLDALWYPFLDLPFFVRCPVALVCHDLYFIRDPSYFAKHKQWRHPLIVRLAKHRMRAASVVVAVSQTVANQATALAGICESKVTVVHNPIFRKDAQSRAPIAWASGGKRYILYVGNNRAHKNLATLVEAFSRLVDEGEDDVMLVLAGLINPQYPDPREDIARRGLFPHRAIHLGPVTDAELDGLYEHALFVALPSLYEGFGIPALEAATRGRAVLCSDIEAFREVLGNQGALYVPPHDVAAWARALAALVRDEEGRIRLAALAHQCSLGFDNTVYAERTIAVLERIALAARSVSVAPATC